MKGCCFPDFYVVVTMNLLGKQIRKGRNDMAEFGENLRKVREEKGITQQTLADYLMMI